MNYNLNQVDEQNSEKLSVFAALKKLVKLVRGERKTISIAMVAVLLNPALSLLGPYLVGYTIDTHVQTKNYKGLLLYSAVLLAIYLSAFVVNYIQMRLMGGIGQRMLFKLRNAVFNKLQDLPHEFFIQNKSGDLISRINHDTDKINQFFSQSFTRFVGIIITMTGAGVLLLVLNPTLALAALSPALALLLYTRVVSPWIRRKNEESLKSLGFLSGEIQENISNFRVVQAFNRRDFFLTKIRSANQENFTKSVLAGIANNILTPVYALASNLGLLAVLALGIWQISEGQFTVGLLISFITYIASFYNPLRQMAALWSNFQMALAAWDRISLLLSFENNLNQVADSGQETSSAYLHFKDVSFAYPNGTEVLHEVNFDLQRGKTYAFVGPTGGGKTTTASLIARLYENTSGSILLDGKDIRSYTPSERANKIGVILQDPILFSGTVRDNIVYGNSKYTALSNTELKRKLEKANLWPLIARFEKGLDTSIQNSGDGISLGQQQIIAFMRAILREPELLILDEATSNIDTVTEQQLEIILQNLPETTTKLIIAHRLNTIENADEIFFVNSGEIVVAGSFNNALALLMAG